MQLRIYYVDDEEALCEAFSDYFSSKKVVITTFTDPTLVIEAINANPPDLLFIDYRLPGMTGDKIAEAISPLIPKFLITGDLSVKTNYKFLKVFSKPFAVQEISQVINTFAAQKSLS